VSPAILFVYGTLRRGCDNPYARDLAAHADHLGAASIPGRLYRFDWHPGAYAAEGPDERVIGEAYRLHDPAPMLAALDAYEGEDYARVTVELRLDSGETVAAWVYMYHGKKVGERVMSGDWLK